MCEAAECMLITDWYEGAQRVCVCVTERCCSSGFSRSSLQDSGLRTRLGFNSLPLAETRPTGSGRVVC